MNTMRPWRLLVAASLVAAGVAALSPPALAQYRNDRGNQGRYADWRQQAYDNGYRAGLSEGENDARARRTFGYERSGGYRDGDRGYSRSYGDRNDYRRVFREGYAAGYSQAHANVSRAGQYAGRAVPRATYPSAGIDGRSTAYGYADPAYDNGFSDGYEKGIDDARDGDRFDPLRHSRYRSGDHGYNGRYGSREHYKNVYRDGFRAGYDQGYREGRQYGGHRNRGRGSRGGGWWPF